ncbi:hypothetical protein R69927_04179 [Paraburkholderia domus]|jgi:acyl carrier protein|uniref:Carrier domain-containing protein n=1 Tax=Paraburkholderia domus TaxID=2793075 RepID=A0A9N8MQP1_9BURK|nr:acyl carrier protein [Paraburkholderia domus]MBK5051431.1 acyl carrier protein [Burkholderia sp. R-70006]MBK5063716.1 acyl carrier protein [Burkholderia sp. R-70199]MBK5088401.1 acyl carrier protein [Burkholderia sp. R-69927]MBK5122798.1 acyl carrier protein [Burkholderia sp. R-69980]MBK5165334.1 acyl carrier protein [Burkholderia sp. R-70211]MBK5182791.1 acyl carrier protein [Burkholderia sp. R-69749]MCI0149044.1 acyl carrier protein [Paraburkholderia sediminicola]
MNAVMQDSQQQRIVYWCAEFIGKVLNLDPTTIGPDDEFDSLGLDSALTTSMIIEMENWLHAEIAPSIFFEQITLGDIAAEVARRVRT